MADRDEQDATRARLVALRAGCTEARRDGPRDGQRTVGDPWPGSDADPAADLLGQAERRAELALATQAAAHAAHGRPDEHPALVGPAGMRWLTRPRVALVAAMALVLLGIGVVGRSLAHGPVVLVSAEPTAPGSGEVAASPGGDGDGAAAPGAAETSTPTPGVGGPGEVVVHVVGAVLAPGVVTLPAGSRVVEAIEAAGGATASADLAALNLARVVDDGEQVLVPTAGAASGGGSGSTSDASGAAAQAPTTVDLNAADLAALDALPGIGPVLAQRIVDWRTEHGRFSTVDELGEVTGIGPSVLAGLRDLVRV